MTQFNSTALRMFVVLGVLALLGFTSGEARADYWICNDTKSITYSAVGGPEKGALLVTGWYAVQPGKCVAAIRGPMPPGSYYVFSRSAEFLEGGMPQNIEWLGPENVSFTLCTHSDAFALKNTFSCKPNGLIGEPFWGFCVTSPGTLVEMLRDDRGSVGARNPGMQQGERVAQFYDGRCANDPLPTRRWKRRYASLAIDTNGLEWGLASRDTVVDADYGALNSCPGNCSVRQRISGHNCIAVGYRGSTSSSPASLSVGTAQSLKRAKAVALRNCSGCVIEGGLCSKDNL